MLIKKSKYDWDYILQREKVTSHRAKSIQMKIGLQVTRYIIDHCMQGASSIKFGTYFFKEKIVEVPHFRAFPSFQ